ncbi:rod shape-determining protein MreC, partial [Bacillus cereus]|uniref:rod shape-determining protein MreC n=1 Tax=Bacillus cereus TaxID=1396 RepID=UPI002841DE1D
TKIGCNAPGEKYKLDVTSVLGDILPKGNVIGKIVEVQADAYGVTKTAYVKPAAD